MKKTLLVAASAALISMPSLANENYIAVELGAGSYTTSGQHANSYFINDDTGFLSLKGGHYFSNNVRAYGYLQAGAESSVEYQDILGSTFAKFSTTTHEFGAGADYLHNLTDKFYLLTGGNLGIYNSTYEVSANGLSKDSTNTGLAAGVNLGLGYNFTDNFSMELGYRHSRFFGNDHEVGVIKLSVDASNTGYLNASYSF
ncbi:outer membrane protein [Vibrio neptunius]|uniref:outer membrane protein n=1 Tax=Vibrio neptunius TaxID=170651 RepID=UPI0019CF9116|nr:outer membrane beta-barrel protein [Vibrio neptunius]MBN3575133.1 outer membrane beta-barrel protein [Vibrio neptunius]QXX07532.1 porin family protein [Vibrio neptunius]